MTEKQQRILKVTWEDFYNFTHGDEMDATSTLIELIQKQAPNHNFEDLELVPPEPLTLAWQLLHERIYELEKLVPSDDEHICEHCQNYGECDFEATPFTAFIITECPEYILDEKRIKDNDRIQS
jgi:hypothetical protein